ncbi:uncharacterized protein LOC114527537 isoform X3 [Dendronephthya gigantea]|uniref:uncharacterized protein LOC114527537 isoform X3 n=1 Tax=Dendronephthya gigantea TaxID=151771 RepID=UPI00106A851C|nr:uncharacterized protein LOC114527537 isoform X3 [Dendronephthya gigantea]
MDIDNDSTEGVENIQNVNAFNDQMPLYPDDYYEKKTRCKKIIFFGIVGIMVAITIIISLSRGASTHVSYVLLGFSIFCITLVEIALILDMSASPSQGITSPNFTAPSNVPR